MRRFKYTVICVGIMLFVSVISLLLLSTLTFWFKWQADKAMIGIILSYIVSGFAGGVCLGRMEKKLHGGICQKENWRLGIEAVKLSTIFILIFISCSGIALQIPFEFSSRFVLIWLLIAGSIFVGLRL